MIKNRVKAKELNPEMPQPKRKAGQPKKTTKDCLPVNWKELILGFSEEGMSDVEIRAKLCLLGGKFSHETWYALIEREEEFSETLKKGKVLCQAWWERVGRDNLRHSKESVFETGCWNANMKNRFGWLDKPADVIDKSTHFHFTSVLQQVRALDEAENKTKNRLTPVRS